MTRLFLVDGRIIKFSELLKLQTSCSNFDYKLNLEQVERRDLTKICEYLAVIEYNKSDYIEDIKAEELENWFEKNKPIMPEIHNLAKYLKIKNIDEYIIKKSKEQKSNKNNNSIYFN